MKVIDLLNKIANGEEAPKKIKYDNLVYEYNEQYDYKNELQINYYSVDNGTDFFNNVFCYSLNDEVEIIEMCHKCGKYPAEYNQTYCEFCLGISEEDNKIEKIAINYLKDDDRNIIIDKINEIIDYINKEE